MRRSEFRTYTVLIQIYESNKQQSYKIMKIKMFAILAKVKLDTENIKVSDLMAVRHTTDQLSKLSLPEVAYKRVRQRNGRL
jgi:hypothetical protein